MIITNSKAKKKGAHFEHLNYHSLSILIVVYHDLFPVSEGAWHWNKKYWNQVNLYGTLEDDFIQALIRHSYSEVVKKLKKQEKLEHPEIMEVVE